MFSLKPLRERLLAIATKRHPDFIVGGKDNPYLLRWFVIPRNPVFNIYLHRFLRSDDDRALHDHPWGYSKVPTQSTRSSTGELTRKICFAKAT